MTITDLLTIAIVMLFLSAYPAALSEIPQTYSVFLPVIQVSPRQIQLGGYLWGDVTKYARYDYLVPGQWVKWDVAWDEVESVQGVYSWPAISDANSEYSINTDTSSSSTLSMFRRGRVCIRISHAARQVQNILTIG